MSLETATFIADLVVTNPESTDGKKQGDDHLRLIKSVLQATFPNATKAWPLPNVEVVTDDRNVTVDDNNMLFAVNTTTEEISLNFAEDLASEDAGWQCYVLKTNSGANAIFLTTEGSSQINGYSQVRRSIENQITHVYWTGSELVATRPNAVPIGTVLMFHSAALPNGHLWCDGDSFSSADYVELEDLLGTTTMPDFRARSPFGLDNDSGVSRNAPAASSAIDDNDIGNTAGAVIVTGFIMVAE